MNKFYCHVYWSLNSSVVQNDLYMNLNITESPCSLDSYVDMSYGVSMNVDVFKKNHYYSYILTCPGQIEGTLSVSLVYANETGANRTIISDTPILNCDIRCNIDEFGSKYTVRLQYHVLSGQHERRFFALVFTLEMKDGSILTASGGAMKIVAKGPKRKRPEDENEDEIGRLKRKRPEDEDEISRPKKISNDQVWEQLQRNTEALTNAMALIKDISEKNTEREMLPWDDPFEDEIVQKPPGPNKKFLSDLNIALAFVIDAYRHQGRYEFAAEIRKMGFDESDLEGVGSVLNYISDVSSPFYTEDAQESWESWESC